MMMVEVTMMVKLLCAHLFSDFVLQTDGMNEGKRTKGWKSACFLLLHSFIHALITYLFVAEWSNWQLPMIIFTSHLIIDTIKCRCGRDGIGIFLVDQLCHVFVLVVLWYLMFSVDGGRVLLQILDYPKTWIIATAYLLQLRPSSILLGLFLKKWSPSATNAQSLPYAGQWIGYIERVLILTFILTGFMECVGFLLAAKSVFRFGELTKAKEIRTTEYVLIGTLSSFALAIFVGIVVNLSI